MIDAYKRFPLKYHVLAIAALTGLAFFFGWKVGEPLVIGGGTLGLLVLLHLFMVKLNSLLAFIAIFMQVLVYASLMVGVRMYGAPLFEPAGVSPNLAFYGLGFYALMVTCSYIYIAYKFSRGRMWINLATAFLLSWITALAVIVFNPLYFVAALTAGFVVGGLFLLIRVPNSKKKADITRPVLTKETAKAAEKLFEENNLTFHKLDPNGPLSGNYWAYNKKTAFIVNVIEPKKEFSVTNSGIMSDELNLIPMLENTQQSIRNVKKEHFDLVPVLLVMSQFKNLNPIMSVNISKWKQPDYMLGVMNIVTTKGFSRLIRATEGEMKDLPTKKIDQIETFAQKLTSDIKV